MLREPTRRSILSAAGGAIAFAISPGEASALAEKNPTYASVIEGSSQPIMLDTDIGDFGGAINGLMPDLSDGDVILVPPAQYDIKSTATISKQISILGIGRSSKPLLSKKADVPAIELHKASQVGRLRLDSAINDESVGIRAHQTTHIEDVSIVNQGSHAIHLHQSQPEHNLNHTTTSGVITGYNGGDGIRIEKSVSGPTNLNAQKIELLRSMQNGGWGINRIQGFGNTNMLWSCHGANQKGAIRNRGDYNAIYLNYVEKTVPKGTVFDGVAVYCSAFHNIIGLSSGDEIEFSHPSQRLIRLGNVTRPMIEFGGGRYPLKVDGPDLETVGDGRGLIVSTPDGSGRYRISVDNDGNIRSSKV